MPVAAATIGARAAAGAAAMFRARAAGSGLRKARNGDAGVSLIEVLAALLVLSFGLLGAAAISAYALGELGTARSYNRATALAGDLANRLRSYGGPAGAAAADCGGGAPCMPASMPAAEYSAWHARVAGELPAGRADVASSTAGGLTQYRITVGWSERGGAIRRHVLTVAVRGAPL